MFFSKPFKYLKTNGKFISKPHRKKIQFNIKDAPYEPSPNVICDDLSRMSGLIDTIEQCL